MDHSDDEFNNVKFLNLFRILRLATLLRYFERILLRFEVDDKYFEIIKILSFWTICIHWAACLQVIPGSLAVESNFEVEVDAWFQREIYQHRDAYGQYVVCLFRSLKILMGIGPVVGLESTMYFDKVYSVMLTIIARIGFFITVGYMYVIIQGMKSSTLRYDEMIVQLNKYTDQNKLPDSTKTKLKDNYDYIFNKRYFSEKEILKTVSAPLRQQILIHNTRKLVENSPFFEKLPSFLILKIISALSVELYLEGDIIYTSGEIGLFVYFITSGSVAFFTPSGNEVCQFADGDYFGVFALISDVGHHQGEVVALETTECYK